MDTSAHTVLPNGWRSAEPQRTARVSTRSSPRPDSPSGADVGGIAGGPFRGGRVRDLDADQARCRVDGDPETEVVSGFPAVEHGVRGEFGDHEGDRARRIRRRRIPPLLQVPYSELPG